MFTKPVVFIFLTVTVVLVAIAAAAALAERQATTFYDTREIAAALTETIDQAATRVQEQEAVVDALLGWTHRAVDEASDEVRSLGVSNPLARQRRNGLEQITRPDPQVDQSSAPELETLISNPRDKR